MLKKKKKKRQLITNLLAFPELCSHTSPHQPMKTGVAAQPGDTSFPHSLILTGGEQRLSVVMSQEVEVEGGDVRLLRRYTLISDQVIARGQETLLSMSHLYRSCVQPLVFVSTHLHTGEQVTD